MAPEKTAFSSDSHWASGAQNLDSISIGAVLYLFYFVYVLISKAITSGIRAKQDVVYALLGPSSTTSTNTHLLHRMTKQ